MDYLTLAIAVLGLVTLFWLSVKSVHSIRRVGVLRFGKALGAFIAAVVGAIIGLAARRRPSASTGAGEGVALATEEDPRDKAWEKVGAVSVPEQYVHHPDPEIAGLAQAHLDDD